MIFIIHSKQLLSDALALETKLKKPCYIPGRDTFQDHGDNILKANYEAMRGSEDDVYVILKCGDCPAGVVQCAKLSECKRLVLWHFLKILKEPCTEHPRISDSYGITFYTARLDCPKCMEEIEKDIYCPSNDSVVEIIARCAKWDRYKAQLSILSKCVEVDLDALLRKYLDNHLLSLTISFEQFIQEQIKKESKDHGKVPD